MSLCLSVCCATVGRVFVAKVDLCDTVVCLVNNWLSVCGGLMFVALQ